VTNLELFEAVAPDISHIETEDGSPVDGIRSEKQMRLLVESLHTSWTGPAAEGEEEKRFFAALANVGLFYAIDQPPLVPDVMVSLDVKLREDLTVKQNRSYFLWEYGKPPDSVIEIVSNRKGGEDSTRMRTYARLGVAYYVIFDPDHYLSSKPLRIYELRHRQYVEMKESWMPALGLGLRLWHGTFEDIEDTWLRWCDIDGEVIATGAEAAAQQRQRAEQADVRAEQAETRAEQAETRAEQERARAERLAEQLRGLGIDPQTVT